MLSLSIGLIASFLIIGFVSNAEPTIISEGYKQIDYGVLSIVKENRTETKNGGLSIVRNSRPSLEEMKSINHKLSDYEIDLNLSSLMPMTPIIKYQKTDLKDFSFNCVFSFTGKYINHSLLLEGRFPKDDGLKEVVINQKAHDELFNLLGSSPLGKTLMVKYETTSDYYFEDIDLEPVSDYFVFDKSVKIVGVVDDLSFLSTPKIYYSYLDLKNYLSTIYLNNLSKAFNKNISWIDRIDECSGSDYLSSYSYMLFLKNIDNVSFINSTINDIPLPFVISSNAEIRTNALIGLINAASTGMEVFLIIALIGTALIMGIVSFSFYSEERKIIATLSCLGAKNEKINDIYFVENVALATISFIFSIIVSPLLELLINFIIFSLSGINNLIKIPITSFNDIPLALPLLVMGGTLLIATLSTYLPIAFSKKISLKEELKDE